MKFQHPHGLGKDEAKRRIAKLLGYWQSSYGVQVDWQGDAARVRGKVRGIEVDAGLTVGEKAVDAEGTDPGLLVRAAATAYFKKKLSDYLDPSRSPEDIEKLG